MEAIVNISAYLHHSKCDQTFFVKKIAQFGPTIAQMEPYDIGLLPKK
jgi:hypothetical protein